MLDDLKYIHERDAQDALGIAERQWQQLGQSFELPKQDFTIDNIVYAGMGGSALAALLSTSWPRHKIPFEVVRNYEIPDYVSENTLFIGSSYSGNTEETLAALAAAEAKNAHIAIITSGGKLLEIAETKQYLVAKLPDIGQPRYAVLYNLKALVSVLESVGLLTSQLTELEQAAYYLKSVTSRWRADVPTAKNLAKQIAQELIGKSIVVYAGPKFYPVAYKWKINFNENAKHIAWLNQLPEFNHNEFLGWTKQPVDKPYAVIDLRSKLENERVQKRFVITEQLLSGLRPQPIVVEPEGKDLLEQMLYTMALGDFVSLYVALLNNLNPTPVDLIERLKKELAT